MQKEGQSRESYELEYYERTGGGAPPVRSRHFSETRLSVRDIVRGTYTIHQSNNV